MSFNENGVGLAAGVALCLLGLGLLAAAARQYRGKGAPLCPAWFAAAKEDRERLDANKARRYAGRVLLYAAVPVLLLGGSFLLDNVWLAQAGATLAAAGGLSAFLFVVTQQK